MEETIPTLPQDIWRIIITIIEHSDNELIDQLIHYQTLAEVSKELNQLIWQKLAEECIKQWPTFVPKLINVKRDNIGLVGIFQRCLFNFCNNY